MRKIKVGQIWSRTDGQEILLISIASGNGIVFEWERGVERLNKRYSLALIERDLNENFEYICMLEDQEKCDCALCEGIKAGR